MAWIKEISKEENQLLKEIYEGAEKRTKETTANVLKVHSVRPEVLAIHMQLYEQIMFKEGALSRMQREMIGVVVSKANSCPYCVGHHGSALAHVTKDKSLMEKIIDDYHKAGLSALDLMICTYAEKLTKEPFKVVEEDIIGLRNLGLSDKTIFDVNHIIAYFNYVNRIVHGLGVELE
ncbi:MAG: peroxidase-related enzyme [Candidatus Izemoplasmataceae bacterium]|uniref:peroxidase-related enzyme n=1 Tax=Liberiplasma polymorphum TaxID=3374570 RepID=UPI0037709AFF